MKSTTVILGLGSNLGDRAGHLRAAIRRLAPLLGELCVSGIVESPALLKPDSPKDWDKPYLNLAVLGHTTLPPEKLLSEIKSTETQIGRKPGQCWAPREIDIDILAMDNMVMQSAELSIPHAELLNRNFALVPMAELSPEFIYPVGVYKGKTIADIVAIKKYKAKPWRNTKLVGIVNVTPDSFSDGGKSFNAGDAISAIEALIYDGADVIDIGAESARPGATPIAAEEEWARLAPVLAEIGRFEIPFSLDTRHADTAKKALDTGVQWINDVSGFSSRDMLDAVKNSDCTLVLMHSLGVPADKSIVLPPSADVVETLLAFARERMAALDAQRMVFDPGIGFGKTAQQSELLIKECRRFRALGLPLYYGHSRKSFLGEGNRDEATLRASRTLIDAGVDYLRVHNVAAHKKLLRECYA